MKKQIILACMVLTSFLSVNQIQAQQDGFIGEIKMFAGNFAPRSWAFCEGQLLSISQNDALFSILGTIYGGDGRTTFALPDLRGRAPVGAGGVAGLAIRRLGSKFGVESVTLNTTQMPSHGHSAVNTVKIAVSTAAASEKNPNGKFIANHSNAFNPGFTAAVSLAGVSSTIAQVGLTGGNQAHNNMQPYNTINYIICLYGVFPSRS